MIIIQIIRHGKEGKQQDKMTRRKMKQTQRIKKKITEKTMKKKMIILQTIHLPVMPTVTLPAAAQLPVKFQPAVTQKKVHRQSINTSGKSTPPRNGLRTL